MGQHVAFVHTFAEVVPPEAVGGAYGGRGCPFIIMAKFDHMAIGVQHEPRPDTRPLPPLVAGHVDISHFFGFGVYVTTALTAENTEGKTIIIKFV